MGPHNIQAPYRESLAKGRWVVTAPGAVVARCGDAAPADGALLVPGRVAPLRLDPEASRDDLAYHVARFIDALPSTVAFVAAIADGGDLVVDGYDAVADYLDAVLLAAERGREPVRVVAGEVVPPDEGAAP